MNTWFVLAFWCWGVWGGVFAPITGFLSRIIYALLLSAKVIDGFINTSNRRKDVFSLLNTRMWSFPLSGRGSLGIWYLLTRTTFQRQAPVVVRQNLTFLIYFSTLRLSCLRTIRLLIWVDFGQVLKWRIMFKFDVDKFTSMT